MQKKQTILYFTAILLFLLGLRYELAFLTWMKNAWGVFQSPVAWLAAGLVSCLAGWYLLRHRNRIVPTTHSTNQQLINIAVIAVILAAGIFNAHQHLSSIFAKYPVSDAISDIIPSLELYVQRWLGGETVYAPLVFSSWTVQPTYFPLLWMPYAFSELLQIDYRWTPFILFIIALILLNYRLLQSRPPFWECALKAALPFLILHSYFTYEDSTFGMAVELTPVAFYIILCLSIFHRSKWVIAAGIVLCLMSRYAFTFWLPVYLLILLMERGFKFVFQTSLLVGLGVLLVYVIPFLSKDPGIFTRGLAYYSKTAQDQWKPQSWQKADEVPAHLGRGVSFAMYFYSYDKYTVPDRLKFNRKVHIALCAGAALFILLGYFLVVRRYNWDRRHYLMVGLKFYLLFFYGFFYAPFAYLFQLPLLLSLPIFYAIPLTIKNLKKS